MAENRRFLRTAAFWVLAVILADQFSKMWVLQNLQLGDGFAVTSWFNMVRVHNTGAAFSFLADAGGWQRWGFVMLALAASVWMAWMMRQHANEKAFVASLALIMGGALANAIDRLWLGYVVDFIDLHATWLSGLFVGGHYPAFNLADSAITLGVVLMIGDELRRWLRSR